MKNENIKNLSDVSGSINNENLIVNPIKTKNSIKSKLNFSKNNHSIISSNNSEKDKTISKNSLQSTNEDSKKFKNFSGILETSESDIIYQNICEDKIFKLILIGDRQTGKTLLRNKILDEISESNPTNGLEIKKRMLIHNEKTIKLEIWDTSVQILSSPIMQSIFLT